MASRRINRVCAAVLRGGQILMVKHTEAIREYWTLPGGAVEPGEIPAQAAARELREETGLDGRVVRRLYDRQIRIAGQDALERCFLISVDDDQVPSIGRDPELPDDHQILFQVGWFDLAELSHDVQVSRILRTGPK